MKTMTKRLWMVLAVMANAVCICMAQDNIVRMLPENGATEVNIDTHLTLIMSDDVTIGQKGFVSVYDKQTGKLVDRLDMSIPAGPTERQPKNPKAQYTPVPYIYKSQPITNRNTKAGTPSGVNAWDKGRYQLDIIGGFSDTCAAILRHIGMPAFVTSQPDAAGMVEAVERGAEEIFMADDLTCTMLDLPTHTSAENSACTGLGFAAALAARLGRLRGRRITVLGAGPVGSNAAEYFLERGAEVVIYDTDEAKTAAWRGRDRVCVARTSAEALALSNIYFEATTARDTIQDEDMDDATLVAAPGIPLGVSEAAMAHHGAQVIHDPLELGVASMAYVLQAKAIMAAAAVKKQIG